MRRQRGSQRLAKLKPTLAHGVESFLVEPIVAALAADFGSMQALSGSNDNSVRLWDLDQGAPIWELRGHTPRSYD